MGDMLREMGWRALVPCLGTLSLSVGLSCGDSGGDDGCETDKDCEGGLICTDGACVEPSSGACTEPGDVCAGTIECCEAAVCVTDGASSVCAAVCMSNDQCNSACCAAVSGTDKSVCSPASFCMGAGGGAGA